MEVKLKVVCAHVQADASAGRRGLHPLCERALATHAPDADMIDLGGRHDAYRELLAELWQAGRSFLIVEQDIEIHETVIPELSACPEPWCLYGYDIGWPPAPVESALGCTRFSRSLLMEAPRVIADLPVRDWRRLDCEIFPRLRDAGFRPHAHYPLVAHHHAYPAPGGLRCSCGREDCHAQI